MDPEPTSPLRVLVADGQQERLYEVARVVATLGHEVILLESGLTNIGPVTVAERPDAALVIVGEASDRALELIGDILHQAACPVIAILDVQNRAFVKEAAKRGLFAYITDGDDPDELQSSIDIVLRRFAEYHALEGAFARRAVTERAKGILMERHSIDEKAAFEMLRGQARRTNQKLIDVAEAVILSRSLLPSAREVEADSGPGGDQRDQ